MPTLPWTFRVLFTAQVTEICASGPLLASWLPLRAMIFTFSTAFAASVASANAFRGLHWLATVFLMLHNLF